MTETTNQENSSEPKSGGILDTISYSQQSAALRTFSPQEFLFDYLGRLGQRERQVLFNRYGLQTGGVQTLETIGKQLNLTRERVRQIEKESTKKLALITPPEKFSEAIELIFKILEERGQIAAEGKILETLLTNQNDMVGQKCILFMLNISPRFNLIKESGRFHQSWYINGFDETVFERTMVLAKEILAKFGKPVLKNEFYGEFRKTAVEDLRILTDEILESYTDISKELDKNSFLEIGLANWPQIHPKDVGDKIYLVLLHHGRPEHYEKITEMINKQAFDNRTAHKETVHNELIKDERFVLVGRGIYALREWGYKKGVVSDIVREILNNASQPLARDEIIKKVLEQRFVKKNTIIVGLSNRKLFQKTPDNKYTNV